MSELKGRMVRGNIVFCGRNEEGIKKAHQKANALREEDFEQEIRRLETLAISQGGIPKVLALNRTPPDTQTPPGIKVKRRRAYYTPGNEGTHLATDEQDTYSSSTDEDAHKDKRRRERDARSQVRAEAIAAIREKAQGGVIGEVMILAAYQMGKKAVIQKRFMRDPDLTIIIKEQSAEIQKLNDQIKEIWETLREAPSTSAQKDTRPQQLRKPQQHKQLRETDTDTRQTEREETDDGYQLIERRKKKRTYAGVTQATNRRTEGWTTPEQKPNNPKSVISLPNVEDPRAVLQTFKKLTAGTIQGAFKNIITIEKGKVILVIVMKLINVMQIPWSAQTPVILIIIIVMQVPWPAQAPQAKAFLVWFNNLEKTKPSAGETDSSKLPPLPLQKIANILEFENSLKCVETSKQLVNLINKLVKMDQENFETLTQFRRNLKSKLTRASRWLDANYDIEASINVFKSRFDKFVLDFNSYDDVQTQIEGLDESQESDRDMVETNYFKTLVYRKLPENSRSAKEITDNDNRKKEVYKSAFSVAEPVTSVLKSISELGGKCLQNVPLSVVRQNPQTTSPVCRKFSENCIQREPEQYKSTNSDHDPTYRASCVFRNCRDEIWAACERCSELLCWEHFINNETCTEHVDSVSSENEENIPPILLSKGMKTNLEIRRRYAVDGEQREVSFDKVRKGNKRKIAHDKRVAGEAYVSSTSGKAVLAKGMKPRCTSEKCKSTVCSISDVQRQKIFNAFYGTKSLQQQREFIIRHVQIKAIKRKRTDKEVSRRQADEKRKLELEDAYNNHTAEKISVRRKKEEAKETSKLNPSVLAAAVFDLQQVIQLPKNGCSGQNRNTIVLAMMLYVITNAKNMEKIVLSYFETNHGQSEGDSAHSSISHAISLAGDIFIPAQLPPILKLARRAMPYNVITMSSDDFYNYKALAEKVRIRSIRKFDSGEDVDWTKVKEVMVRKHQNTRLFVKNSHLAENYYTLSLKRNALGVMNQPLLKLNNGSIKLDAKKYNDLVQLCGGRKPVVRNELFQKNFRDLPHNNN
ncbi:unnamed protein product [Ceutorhynchus assimilis]|uniref:Uncharacterized protein n=1 Tax=Ceutorhynchus assimilis TaxID=467358 RepID=A0A9N9MMZ9_9CUCU|nr:unnamed protein product [Ceutorhynchus assimilis]